MATISSEISIINVNELTDNLKQLFISSSCHLENIQTFDDLKNTLNNLDKIDDEFKSFDLISNIHSKLDKMIKIDEDKYTSLSENLQDSAYQLAQEIIKTDKYQDFINDLIKKTQLASKNLVGYNSNLELKSLLALLSDHMYSKNTEILYDGESLADDTISCSSSVMFLRIETQNKIATNLSLNSTTEKRKAALESCFRMNGIVNILSEVWKSVKQSLKNILLSFDNELWMKAIKIVAKNLCLSGNSILEMYSLLIEVLITEISGSKSQFRIFKQCLNPQNSYTRKLLIAFRIICQFLQDISQKHIERNIFEIIEMTIELFCLHSSKDFSLSNQLTPMNFISLVDLHAFWFSKLMHGVKTRIILLRVLKNKEYFLKHIIHYSLEAIKAFDSNNFEDEPIDNVYTIEALKVIKLKHYLSILLKFVSYKSARLMFPISISDKKHIKVTDIILSAIQIVFKKQDQRNSNGVLNKLISLSLSNETCQSCFLNEQIIESLLEKIGAFVNDNVLNMEVIRNASNSLFLMQAIMSYPVSVSYILDSQNQQNYGHELIALTIKSFKKLFNTFKDEQINNEFEKSVFSGLLNICGKLAYDWPVLEGNELLQLVFKAKQLKIIKDFNCIYYEFIFNLIESSKGLMILENNTQLLDDLCSQISSDMSNIDLNGIISQICCLSSSAQYLHKTELISYALDQLRILSKPTIVLVRNDAIEKEIAFDLLMNLMICRRNAEIFICNTNYHDHLHVLSPPPFNSILAFFQYLIYPNFKLKENIIFDFEYLQEFGLRLIKFLLSSLDTMLLLEEKFKLTTSMLKLQLMCVNETTQTIIIDKKSLLRNQILIQCNLLGGPNEKIMPANDYNKVYDYPLFFELPIPKYYLYDFKKHAVNSQSTNTDNLFSSGFLNEMEDIEILHQNILSTVDKNINYIGLSEIVMKIYKKKYDINKFDCVQITADINKPNQLSLPIKLIINYGISLDVLTNEFEVHEKNLNFLLHEFNSSEYNINGHFNWFASLCYLFFGGNLENVYKILSAFYMENYTNHNQSIENVMREIVEEVEYILRNESKEILDIFKISGFSIFHIIQLWFSQNFLNYFDFTEIYQYLYLILIFGVKYYAYVCVAVLMHLKAQLRSQLQSATLKIFICEEGIQSFKFVNEIDLLLKLYYKYNTR